MPRRAASALLIAGAIGVAGCGGPSGNGVAAKSPDAIITASRQAALTATSLHVAGSVPASGAPTSFDLSLVAGHGATGSLTINRVRFDLIRIGRAIYVKGSPAFYRRFGRTAAQLLVGRWLKGDATAGSFSGIGPFTDLQTFLGKVLSPGLRLTKGTASTIAGVPSIAVRDPSGGTLRVATTGKPYPVTITQTGASGGTVTFDRWNAAVLLRAPADAVDLKQLAAGR